MRSVILVAVFAFALSSSVFGAVPYLSHWEASSGLTPDQVGYNLFNTSVPETPVLSPTKLTLANDALSETMFYTMAGPELLLAETTEISFRMRYVSGSGPYPGRAPAAVFATTAPGIGASLYIGSDEIFLNSGSIYSRGPQNTSVDTDSSFHDYLLRIEGDTSGSPVSVFQDGNLVLTGALIASTSDNGLDQRIGFGELSIWALGTSEWESFSHNAVLIPEPTALCLLSLGSLALVAGARRIR
jgi:hypothetical protein